MCDYVGLYMYTYTGMYVPQCIRDMYAIYMHVYIGVYVPQCI